MDMWSSRGVLQTIRLEELCCKHKPRLSRRKGRATCRNGDYVKGLKDRGFVCSAAAQRHRRVEENGADLCLMGVGKTCIRGGAKGTIYVRATYDSDSARTLNEVLIEKQFSGKSQRVRLVLGDAAGRLGRAAHRAPRPVHTAGERLSPQVWLPVQSGRP